MQNIYHQTVASPSAELYVVSLWIFLIQIEINFDANGCCHILNYMDFVLNVIRLHEIHIFVWFFDTYVRSKMGDQLSVRFRYFSFYLLDQLTGETIYTCHILKHVVFDIRYYRYDNHINKDENRGDAINNLLQIKISCHTHWPIAMKLLKFYRSHLWCQRYWSTFVQVVACHLFGSMPLPKPMLTYHQWDTKELVSVKIYSVCIFSFKRMHLKMSSAKYRPFRPGLYVLFVLWNTCFALNSQHQGSFHIWAQPMRVGVTV